MLAACALLLFLNHLIAARTRHAAATAEVAVGAGAGAAEIAVEIASGTAELKAEATALLRCAQVAPFRAGFEDFFASVQGLANRSGPTTLAEWKREVVRTLLPMAPYLAGM